MKDNKIIMLCAAIVVTLCSFASLSAQDMTIRNERKVPEEQIPVAIRNSFQQEFGAEDDAKKGAWYIYFEQQNVNNRPVATPLAYIYRAKRQGERVEVKYDTAGKLESTKGIAKKETQTTSSN